MSALNSNPNRASLLSGLRTGGVRPPMTAAPNASSFVIPEEQYITVPHQPANRAAMTAAVDGPSNRFSQQQQQPMQPFTPMNPFQMQAMQLEMLKLQAMQAQQYQEMILAQSQRQPQHPQQQQQRQFQQQQQSQQQQQNRRASYQPPATAGPAANSFDLRSSTLNAQLRRANVAPTQADLMKAQPGVGNMGQNDANQLPMTASLHGKFGTRSTSVPMPTMISQQQQQLQNTKPSSVAAAGTTVISGGTSLGSLSSNNAAPTPATPSKSDAATSWRRGGTSISNRSVTAPSPAVKVTPPSLNSIEKRSSPPPLPSGSSTTPSTAVPGSSTPTSGNAASKFRPKPLSFNAAAQQPMIPSVLIDTSETEEDESSSTSGTSGSVSGDNTSERSSPTTSNELLSGSLNGIMQPPLSPREEASKRLYEGLGIGRPRSRNSDSGEQVVIVQAEEPMQTAAPFVPRAQSVNMAPPQTAALFPNHQSSIAAFPQSPFAMAPMPHTASLTNPNYMNRLDRHASQPKRQPRGPPSGADELGPKNFATRGNRAPPPSALLESMPKIAVEAY